MNSLRALYSPLSNSRNRNINREEQDGPDDGRCWATAASSSGGGGSGERIENWLMRRCGAGGGVGGTIIVAGVRFKI